MTRAAKALVAAALALALIPAVGPPAARAAPAIDAPSGILIDASSGEPIVAKAPDDRRAIASATKLMTALVAIEGAEPDDVLRAPRYRALAVESLIGLEEGERMTVRDLLTALLLESANDAAVTLAEGIAGSEAAFVDRMNRRARELGLSDTRFANPIGLDDPDNYSTAHDLARLARQLMRDATFAAIVGRPQAMLESGDRRRVVENRNQLVAQTSYVDGVKTGHTLDAGHVLVGSATRPDAAVISVVLGAPSEAARDATTLDLLRHGLDQFTRRVVVREDRPVGSAAIAGRDGEVALTTPRDLTVTVRRGGGEPRRQVAAPAELEGPLPAGHEVGSVEVVYEGKVAGRAPLVTTAAVPAPSASGRIADVLTAPLTLVALLAIVSASAVALARWRSASTRTPRTP